MCYSAVEAEWVRSNRCRPEQLYKDVPVNRTHTHARAHIHYKYTLNMACSQEIEEEVYICVFNTQTLLLWYEEEWSKAHKPHQKQPFNWLNKHTPTCAHMLPCAKTLNFNTVGCRCGNAFMSMGYEVCRDM